ncbi:MAG: nicotinate-nucleotide--dimethylbenzimidazole phosphoribosyltransferase [Clostridium sp.]
MVFCADNGVVAEGVTQTDSSVTAGGLQKILPGALPA